MRHWHLVAVATVLVWGLLTPLAMAFSGCLAMGDGCEGPCGVSSCVVSAPVTADVNLLVTAATPESSSHTPAIDPTVLELPPK